MRNLRTRVSVYFLAAAALCGSFAISHAAEIVWRKSYGDAIAESQLTQKPILVQFKAKWCTACTQMSLKTLAESKVAEYVNRAFIPLQIDADEHPDLVSSFSVESLPASLVVAPNRKILARLEGFQSVVDFMSELTRFFPHDASLPVNVPL